MLIPRIFHQIWLGPNPFPDEFRRYQQTWLDHHRGWELRFWTEDNLPTPLRRPEATERLRSPAERADVLRLEVVWRFGGAYVDVDLECLGSIEPLIDDAEFFAALAGPDQPSNGLFGAVAGNRITDDALIRIRPREYPGYDAGATGSRFFARLVAPEPGVTLLGDEQLALSHAWRPWKSLEAARNALVKAERRQQAAQDQIRLWRSKYETAAAEQSTSEQAERRLDATRAESSMRIPRIFHQIWLGPNPLPDEYARYQQTWVEHHPGWELRFWTEDNLPTPLRRPEAAQRLRTAGERSDILRLELLWRFGGVYLDTDFECLRCIEPLIEDADFFVAQTAPGRVRNGFFGAAPGHSILDRALDQLRPREFYGYEMESGPKFLDRVVATHGDEVLLLDPQILDVTMPESRRTAYAVHHAARSWKDADLLWIDLQRDQQKMELKLQLALEQAGQLRARLEAAEAAPGRRRSTPRRFALRRRRSRRRRP